jgi:hypothetical protein
VQLEPIRRDRHRPQRVIADVAGKPLWYESADVDLDESPEALASATLIAAALAGKGLISSGEVSRTWLDNAGKLLDIASQWWDFPVVLPEAPVVGAERPRAAGVALCFTGGVDSFHTLLRGAPKPDLLAFVHGYDIALKDRDRMDVWEVSLREIAAARDARAVVIRSNLPTHRLLVRRNWERTHGGAVAAVGHLLASEIDTLLISSGAPPSYEVTWGSHWQLDPLWSSDRLTVVHYGVTHSRVTKMQEIADDELVQRHLRVCWENRTAAGNCSRCDKCVSTMVLAALCGPSDRFEVFDWSGSLSDRIDDVPWTRFVRTYGEVLATDIDLPLANAIQSLLQRTAKHDTRRRPLVRRLARRARLLR